jgi:tetratricopeptide (TPR) repeat protein
MAKMNLCKESIGLIVLLIVLLNILVGCYGPDSGRSQFLPSPMKTVSVVDAGETDIIEKMSANRLAYRQYLESLIVYYKKTGDNMKLRWAEDELKRLNKMPQYNYIIEASVAGPDLKAREENNSANYLYDEAYRLEKAAKKLILIVDDNLLRVALDKYNQLIKQYPTSDKIDDAAFRAAGIYKHFKDYTIAVLYYQRTYQWDPDTIYPARFKAAYILDEHLLRRAEALDLYQQAVKKEKLSEDQKKFAEKRIAELTKSGETIKEDK